MPLGRYMMSQFARPHGLLAGVFAAVMNGGNKQVNLRSLEALDVKLERLSVQRHGDGARGNFIVLRASAP